MSLSHSNTGTIGNASTLGDILERVLDKGIVIAGDIKISLADVDLLNIKIRLVICSVDKAMEMGINWWEQDASLSTKAQSADLEKENALLKMKLKELEAATGMSSSGMGAAKGLPARKRKSPPKSPLDL